MYVIEKNIPVPPGNHSKYPFAKMEVGDSFLVKSEGKEPKNLISSIRQASYNCTKKSGMKFRARIEGENVRVWRVA